MAANGTLPSVDARVSALQARAVMVTGTGWVLDPLPFLSYLKGVLGVFCGSCWLARFFFSFLVSADMSGQRTCLTWLALRCSESTSHYKSEIWMYILQIQYT